MVNWCSIKGCSNNSKIPGIKLHRVSKDNIGKYWTAVVQKVNPNFVLTAYSVVFSDHFDVSDYLVRGKLGNTFKKKMLFQVYLIQILKKHIFTMRKSFLFFLVQVLLMISMKILVQLNVLMMRKIYLLAL